MVTFPVRLSQLAPYLCQPCRWCFGLDGDGRLTDGYSKICDCEFALKDLPDLWGQDRLSGNSLVLVTHNAGFIAVLSNSFVVGLYCFGADVFECLNSRNDKLCTET
jgi:hypothetical protein